MDLQLSSQLLEISCRVSTEASKVLVLIPWSVFLTVQEKKRKDLLLAYLCVCWQLQCWGRPTPLYSLGEKDKWRLWRVYSHIGWTNRLKWSWWQWLDGIRFVSIWSKLKDMTKTKKKKNNSDPKKVILRSSNCWHNSVFHHNGGPGMSEPTHRKLLLCEKIKGD